MLKHRSLCIITRFTETVVVITCDALTDLHPAFATGKSLTRSVKLVSPELDSSSKITTCNCEEFENPNSHSTITQRHYLTFISWIEREQSRCITNSESSTSTDLLVCVPVHTANLDMHCYYTVLFLPHTDRNQPQGGSRLHCARRLKTSTDGVLLQTRQPQQIDTTFSAGRRLFRPNNITPTANK